MFILTNIDAMKDLVQVFDTKDGTNDVIRLSALASQVNQRKLKVYGMGRLDARHRKTASELPQLGIYIDVMESKEAFATYYQKLGCTRQVARAKAGLTT